jgi:hypothetical protein
LKIEFCPKFFWAEIEFYKIDPWFCFFSSLGVRATTFPFGSSGWKATTHTSSSPLAKNGINRLILARVTRWVCEKNRPKCSQTQIVINNLCITYVYVLWKKFAPKLPFCNKKLPKYENSYYLVTPILAKFLRVNSSFCLHMSKKFRECAGTKNFRHEFQHSDAEGRFFKRCKLCAYRKNWRPSQRWAQLSWRLRAQPPLQKLPSGFLEKSRAESFQDMSLL